MKVTLAKSAATLVVAAGCLAISGGVAQAMPPDTNGDRISWNSQLPCSDGGSGMYVSTAPRYLTPGAGYYQERVVVYTNAGARLAMSPLWKKLGYSAIDLATTQGAQAALGGAWPAAGV